MYALHLRSGVSIPAAVLQKAIADLPFPVGSQSQARGFAHICQIERLCSRGMSRANEDFDVLSGALNFLDAVAPEVSDHLRSGWACV